MSKWWTLVNEGLKTKWKGVTLSYLQLPVQQFAGMAGEKVQNIDQVK
jgi:hypothetical protein